MSKNIEDLRDRLFAAIDGLADREKPMEVDRARAIADLAQVLVDSAKAEIHLLQVSGARGTATEFIPLLSPPPAPGQRRLAAGACSHCGGRLKPETDGNGGLVDRCRDCGRSPGPVPAPTRA